MRAKMKTVMSCLTLVTISLMGVPVDAALVGITQGGAVYHIDPADGSFQIINDDIGIPPVNGLANDSNGRILTNGLYELDPTTGAASLFVPVTEYIPIVGGIRGFSFAPDNTLYAIHNRNKNSGRDYLTTVDLTTGEIAEIGYTGRTNIQSIAFGPDGTLYANDTLGLGRVDLTTGLFTDISSSFGANIQGMTFDDMGNLFGVNHAQLFSIDTTTGSHTYIGDTAQELRGLAFTTATLPTTRAKLELKVIFTDPPTIADGQFPFGFSEFPDEIPVSFLLGEGTPAGGGATNYGIADVIAPEVTFGDGVFTSFEEFDMELRADGTIETLFWRFNPIITPTTSNGLIAMNSPLHITGTDIASGEAFSYSYTTSAETITFIPEPSTLALCCLLGLGGVLRRRHRARS